MNRRHHGPATAALLLAVLLHSHGLAAEEPMAALATSVSGTIQPAIAAMSEIPANTAIQVGPGSRVTLMHYRNCVTETVTGGTVTVLASGFDDRSATVEARNVSACPAVEALSLAGAGADAAVTVMRGQAPPGSAYPAASISIPSRSAIYFAGRQAPNIAWATVVDALGRTAADAPSGGAVLHVDLVAGQPYRLRLGVRGVAQPIERALFVTRAEGTAVGTVVLRLQ